MMEILRTLWKSSQADSQALNEIEAQFICHFACAGLWNITEIFDIPGSYYSFNELKQAFSESSR